MKKRLLALVAVVVVGAAAVFYARWQPTPPVDRLVVSGNIEVTEARASFKTGGRVEARLVSEGAVVQAGQTVARLDRVELAQQVALQQAEVHGAAADLAELEAGSRPEEISQGEAALARARAEEERWRAEAARQAALYEQDIVSAREREAAQTALEVARAHVRDAENGSPCSARGRGTSASRRPVHGSNARGRRSACRRRAWTMRCSSRRFRGSSCPNTSSPVNTSAPAPRW